MAAPLRFYVLWLILVAIGAFLIGYLVMGLSNG
jgi:hypothetical protein